MSVEARLCPYCRDPVSKDRARTCARERCEATYHPECWRECLEHYGGCAVYGCGSSRALGTIGILERFAERGPDLAEARWAAGGAKTFAVSLLVLLLVAAVHFAAFTLVARGGPGLALTEMALATIVHVQARLPGLAARLLGGMPLAAPSVAKTVIGRIRSQ